ncbi:hypothetical protein GCM10010106_44680 [Thermopolyspora flexuosa]|nr:hypothetical protein GCM10010106_44680 [Thermopolyspora flexuosa]
MVLGDVVPFGDAAHVPSLGREPGPPYREPARYAEYGERVAVRAAAWATGSCAPGPAAARPNRLGAITGKSPLPTGAAFMAVTRGFPRPGSACPGPRYGTARGMADRGGAATGGVRAVIGVLGTVAACAATTALPRPAARRRTVTGRGPAAPRRSSSGTPGGRAAAPSHERQ